VANVKVEHKASLTRKQVAEALAALASALDNGPKAEMKVAGLEVSLVVPDEVRTEFEIEVDGDEIEIELELKWSTAAPASKTPAPAPKASTPSRRRSARSR
jgi:amphi-Trp domain-containing protein